MAMRRLNFGVRVFLQYLHLAKSDGMRRYLAYYIMEKMQNQQTIFQIIIDREAGEIMRLVAFLCLWVCLFVCMCELS